MKRQKKIATFDIETDPFEFGRETIEPFCCGFYDGTIYKQFWGDDCLAQFFAFAQDLEDEYIIYAHNGGKFDFMFLLELRLLDSKVHIINGRIVKAQLCHHELRDSFAILPVPLAAYKKDDIDYAKFERDQRERYKSEILNYLRLDCIYLYELVTKFINQFGLKLTIGSTAYGIVHAHHRPFKTNEKHDERFRPFYYGGRVQVFKPGIVHGDFKLYDVNSMYPYVMREYRHPNGTQYINGNTLDGIPDWKPFFIRFIGSNNNALPVRTKQGLKFDQEYGEFLTTSHELKVALKYRRIKIDKILDVWIPQNSMTFGSYVDYTIGGKLAAEKAGDATGRLFFKLLANSGYGKFGQNPDNFQEWLIRYDDDPPPDKAKWQPEIIMTNGELWAAPSKSTVYYDVATAASITGAARAVLLEALCRSRGAVYCDTDSIVCTSLAAELHETALGAWKIEARGNRCAVAGKKLYALFDGDSCVKQASKGVRLTPDEIVSVAKGHEITYERPAPVMSLQNLGQRKYQKRRVKRLDIIASV